mgnify:CR=1 FL=1
MIAIIDYGVGNLFSLKSSLKQLGLEAVVTADADTIRKADRLILPGVGAFGDAELPHGSGRAGEAWWCAGGCRSVGTGCRATGAGRINAGGLGRR